MKTILYATDFSENANHALEFALPVAKVHASRLLMAHIVDIPTSWNFPSTEDANKMEAIAIESAKHKLKELFNRFSHATGNEANAEYKVFVDPSVTQGILTLIEENEPDLIVLGRKGGSKLKEIIVGSTTRSLIKKSPKPVLAIPENAIYRGFGKIVYATDFYEQDIEAISQLIGMFKPFDPELLMLHISTPNEYKGEEKMEWFKEMLIEKIVYKKLKFELLLSTDIYNRLNSFLKQYDSDLLVMLEKKQRSLATQIFHGDLVTKMEPRTESPILSFNKQFIRVEYS